MLCDKDFATMFFCFFGLPKQGSWRQGMVKISMWRPQQSSKQARTQAMKIACNDLNDREIKTEIGK